MNKKEQYELNRLRMLAENNPQWKGDTVGLDALHIWITKRMPSPGVCPICGKEATLDLANKGIYDRKLKHWEWLCRRCHMKKDGRLAKLKVYNESRKTGHFRNCIVCQKKFWVRISELKNTKRLYCSYKCFQKKTGGKYIKCLICEAKTWSIKSQPKKYCSRECYYKSKIGKKKNNPTREGGKCHAPSVGIL